MAKSKHKQPAKAPSQQRGDRPFIKVDKKALDPALSSLFASSAGPVEAPPKSRYQSRIQRASEAELREAESTEEEGGDDNASAPDDGSESDAGDSAAESDSSDDSESEAEQSSSENEAVLANLRESVLEGAQEKPAKKRKRGDKEEIEDTYMRKLVREEEKEEEQRQKKRKTEKARAQVEDDSDSSDAAEAEAEAEEAGEEFTIPKHESLADADDKEDQEIEKASRTVFLGNISTECINSKSAEKALKKHLESFIADLADNKPPHKIESIRYRSTAFDNSLPKRAAFAKKEIMDSTTRSTNAYAVYTTKVAAREAVKRLNGSIFLKRHMHVDSVAHPTKIDHRRCVFVGNLPFVDDESQTPAKEGQVKKKRPASDVEEGLWTHFAKAGEIESVRVVRDAATRVGKGFAYIQFHDENSVESALHFTDQNFPPMLPRKLRVTRCRADKKKKKDKQRIALPSTSSSSTTTTPKSNYVAKLSNEQKSLQGRARNILGKVAKAHAKDFVFEGHRAKETQGKSGLKFKGTRAKKGVNGRKSRSLAWKNKK